MCVLVARVTWHRWGIACRLTPLSAAGFAVEIPKISADRLSKAVRLDPFAPCVTPVVDRHAEDHRSCRTVASVSRDAGRRHSVWLPCQISHVPAASQFPPSLINSETVRLHSRRFRRVTAVASTPSRPTAIARGPIRSEGPHPISDVHTNPVASIPNHLSNRDPENHLSPPLDSTVVSHHRPRPLSRHSSSVSSCEKIDREPDACSHSSSSRR